MADSKNTLKIPRGILDEFLECPKSFISVGVFLANCQSILKHFEVLTILPRIPRECVQNFPVILDGKKKFLPIFLLNCPCIKVSYPKWHILKITF